MAHRSPSDRDRPLSADQQLGDDQQLSADGAREFAVLIPLYEHEGRPSVLLTKRPESLKRYSGQVSLPGGAREPDDESLVATALRETFEEVGIPPDHVTVEAELDWHRTTLHHRIKPFLGRVRTPCLLRPDPAEVERVLFVPVARITHELFQIRGTWRDPNGFAHKILTFDLEGYEVWGLTARILYSAFVV